MHKSSSTAYDYAIRSIPILCIAGIVTLIVGVVGERQWVMRVGTCLFLSGFVVWGFANGSGFLWAFIHTIRKHGFRVFKEQPWSSAFIVLVMLFLFYAGYQFVWMMVRALGVTK
jgi:hypothetical protein